MSKPKSIKDWKLSSRAKKVVAKELNEWLKLFIKQADGEEGNVWRADFIKEDTFYFTNCNDILAKDPEAESKETKPKIIKRKQRIYLQLLIKTLLGQDLTKKARCSHCGVCAKTVYSVDNGHFYYCPHCGKVDISAYVGSIEDSAKSVINKIKELKNERRSCSNTK